MKKEELMEIIENTQIAFTDEELEVLYSDLSDTMQVFAAFDAAEISDDIEPLFYPNRQQYYFRDPEVELVTDRDELLSNTLESEDGYFKFPSVLKGGDV